MAKSLAGTARSEMLIDVLLSVRNATQFECNDPVKELMKKKKKKQNIRFIWDSFNGCIFHRIKVNLTIR